MIIAWQRFKSERDGNGNRRECFAFYDTEGTVVCVEDYYFNNYPPRTINVKIGNVLHDITTVNMIELDFVPEISVGQFELLLGGSYEG